MPLLSESPFLASGVGLLLCGWFDLQILRPKGGIMLIASGTARCTYGFSRNAICNRAMPYSSSIRPRWGKFI